MNWCIPIIYPGLWCTKGGKVFCFERVYRNDGKPTWIVLMYFRHVGQPPWGEEEYDITLGGQK